MALKKLHDPDEGSVEAKSKRSRVPHLPGRIGGRGEGAISNLEERGKDETTQDGLGCLYVHGDPADIAEEIQYHIRAQTGTTAGAGKRVHGNGTRFGLPVDEPRHGEIEGVETEPVEGDGTGTTEGRKLSVTE